MDERMYEHLGEHKKFPFKLWQVLAALAAVVFILFYYFVFSATEYLSKGKIEQFVIPLGVEDPDEIAERLQKAGYIRSVNGFKFAMLLNRDDPITPGGYNLSKTINVFQVVSILKHESKYAWVVIPEGLRKEEIAEMLQKRLSWNDEQVKSFITDATTKKDDYLEGVYFPDTYLIPKDATPDDVAKRLTTHFQEKFTPYSNQALSKNIKWTVALTMASIIQREAAGKEDMKLISGILWNRLDAGMPLGIDATVQYIRGNTGNGWWAPISIKNKTIDSPYNTYTHKGLPPHPIANPGLDAIDATINPAVTKCLYYIHDNSKKIHCAATYAEHQRNIEKYL